MTDNLPAVIAPHSELGASIAKRYFACPGSFRMARQVPPAPSSAAAERGTAMHEVAALCLTYDQDAIEYIGRTVAGVEIDDTAAEDVQVYLDYCREVWSSALRASVWIEHRFTLEELNPPLPMFGTADFVAYRDGTLWVADLKTGYGDVQADDNVQLKYYALGAMLSVHPLPVERVFAAIVQPRNGGVKSTEFDAFGLMEWAGELLAAARATQEPDAPCIAGPHCAATFCPSPGVCPAAAREAYAVAQIEFGTLDDDTIPPPVPETLSLREIGRILDKAPQVEAWIDAVRSYAKARAAEGVEIPGYKVVLTEGRDAWRDADTVAKRLADATGLLPGGFNAPPKPLSPAQVRKMLAELEVTGAALDGVKVTKKAAEAKARESLAPFVHRPNTGTALVPATDSRPALAGPGAEFPELPASEEI